MIEKLIGIEHGDFPDDVTKQTKYFTRFHITTEFDENDEKPSNLTGSLVATHTLMQDVQGISLGIVELNYAKIGAKIKLVGLKNVAIKKAG